MDTDMEGTTPEPGGFIINPLPSPAPSNFSNSSVASNLPHPRSKPLKAGSAKEDAARRFVEARLLNVSKRYTKKNTKLEADEKSPGYTSMTEVSKDLGQIIDVVWLSGTPSLQIPYLLNIALAITSYLPSFPPAPKATFGLLRKLDHAFSSLLRGEDSASGEPLPGFDGESRGMSRTDMVRCRSLIETTRVVIVEVMSNEAEMEEEEPDQVPESGDDLETEIMDEDGDGDGESHWDIDEDDEDVGLQMDIAKVYEESLVALGQLLVGPNPYDAGSAQI